MVILKNPHVAEALKVLLNGSAYADTTVYFDCLGLVEGSYDHATLNSTVIPALFGEPNPEPTATPIPTATPTPTATPIPTPVVGIEDTATAVYDRSPWENPAPTDGSIYVWQYNNPYEGEDKNTDFVSEFVTLVGETDKNLKIDLSKLGDRASGGMIKLDLYVSAQVGKVYTLRFNVKTDNATPSKLPMLVGDESSWPHKSGDTYLRGDETFGAAVNFTPNSEWQTVYYSFTVTDRTDGDDTACVLIQLQHNLAAAERTGAIYIDGLTITEGFENGKPTGSLMQVSDETMSSVAAKSPWDIPGPGFTVWSNGITGGSAAGTVVTATTDADYVGYGNKAILVDLSKAGTAESPNGYFLDYTANNLVEGEKYTLKFKAKAIGVADLSKILFDIKSEGNFQGGGSTIEETAQTGELSAEWTEYTFTFIAHPVLNGASGSTGPNTGYNFAGHCGIRISVTATEAVTGHIVLDDFSIVAA